MVHVVDQAWRSNLASKIAVHPPSFISFISLRKRVTALSPRQKRCPRLSDSCRLLGSHPVGTCVPDDPFGSGSERRDGQERGEACFSSAFYDILVILFHQLFRAAFSSTAGAKSGS